MIQTVQVFDQYKEWETQGKLNRLVIAGIISPKQVRAYQMTADFRRELKSRFKTKGSAVVNICDKYKVSRDTFYTGINFMEQEL